MSSSEGARFTMLSLVFGASGSTSVTQAEIVHQTSLTSRSDSIDFWRKT